MYVYIIEIVQNIIVIYVYIIELVEKSMKVMCISVKFRWHKIISMICQ